MGHLRNELRDLASLAMPIALVQLGHMSMSVVDMVFVGRVSGRALAAVGLGNSYAFLLLHFGVGVLMALDPVVSQALGARDTQGAIRGIQRGLLLAVLLCLPVAILAYLSGPLLQALRQPPELVPTASAYVRALIPGLPAFYLYFAFRLSLQAMHRLRPVVISIVLANIANVALDWLLIFGECGFPRLGPVGCGLATSACRWLMLVSMLALGWPVLRPHLRGSWRSALRAAPLWRMFRLGAPIGVQGTLEAAAFASVAFLMGWLGPDEVGGHQITLLYAAFAFMVPLGISSAAAVRVGWAVGREDPTAVRRAAAVALAAGATVMLVSAAFFLTVPGPLARAFTADPSIVPVAIALLPLAGLFQVFDGVQVVASGVLRGIGDVRFPMLVHLAGFWLAGVPLGVTLTFGVGIGPPGLWWGLVAGLGLVALILVLRIRARLRSQIARIDI